MVIWIGIFFFTKHGANTDPRMHVLRVCTVLLRAHLKSELAHLNLEVMKHELIPIKYDKASLTLLAVPLKNSHVIPHYIGYMYVLCATIFGKGARTTRPLKRTLEVRPSAATHFPSKFILRVDRHSYGLKIEKDLFRIEPSTYSTKMDGPCYYLLVEMCRVEGMIS